MRIGDTSLPYQILPVTTILVTASRFKASVT